MGIDKYNGHGHCHKLKPKSHWFVINIKKINTIPILESYF